MSRKTDNERLLADMLSAEPDSEFSANVLAETLRGVRRQRRVRQVRRYGGALAALIVVALAVNHFLRTGARLELARLSQPASYQLVVTLPLPAGQVTETRLFSPDQEVASATSVRLIQTTPGGFGEIGDDELILLAAPSVVALVRRGPHEAELVFVSSLLEDSSPLQN